MNTAILCGLIILVLLVIMRYTAHQLPRIRAYIHKAVLLTKLGHRPFADLQRGLQSYQLLVDEADTILRHFILLL